MGKGGGKGHTPREAKDNLKSTQMMSVIDAIGEGPIEGPVKGLQSILVNKTPLTDTDGRVPSSVKACAALRITQLFVDIFPGRQ
ncbi:hypothetical protein ACCG59_004571 [Escherichia coli]